jgi:hypothetical protein
LRISDRGLRIILTDWSAIRKAAPTARLGRIGAVGRRAAAWNLDRVPSRAAGAASLVLWAAIIVSGRMIAYNWFDCDTQPQPRFVNWAAGCVIDAKRHPNYMPPQITVAIFLRTAENFPPAHQRNQLN